MPIFVPQQGTPAPGTQQTVRIPIGIPFGIPFGPTVDTSTIGKVGKKAVAIVTAPQRAVVGQFAAWATPFAVTAGVALAGALLVIIGLVLLVTSNAQVRKVAEEAVGTTVGAAAKAV